MALGEAILVCLTDGPLSGYDLANTFDTSMGFFWRADHQQIYRELRRLREQGLVDAEHVIQTGRPNKNLWSLTAAGRERIVEWSRTSSDPASIKDDMLLKLYGLGHVDVTALRHEVERRRELHRRRLTLFERILTTRYAEVRQNDPEQVGKHLGLQLGLRYERGWVEWCDQALGDLGHLQRGVGRAGDPPTQATDPSPPTPPSGPNSLHRIPPARGRPTSPPAP